ncbi:MAG TPA: non-canonical purine NTP pyrophosphatase [Candidatus Limiplasma sp.]|nr:non-canonical purine NTP pyrophosphatase [Candidatus Limiplasma sp.]
MKQPLLIYGTTNPGKLAAMRQTLAPLGIPITGIGEIAADIPDVAETGLSPLENARLKALAYHAALNQTVFACDSGLMIDGLPEAEQPGVHVRLANGKRMTDAEMTAHYAAIAARLGGRAAARYQNAICLITAEGTLYEHSGDDISGETFYLISTPHPKRVAGFPLDCLSVRTDNGRYYYDCPPPADNATQPDAGFRAFFRNVLRAEMEEA